MAKPKGFLRPGQKKITFDTVYWQKVVADIRTGLYPGGTGYKVPAMGAGPLRIKIDASPMWLYLAMVLEEAGMGFRVSDVNRLAKKVFYDFRRNFQFLITRNRYTGMLSKHLEMWTPPYNKPGLSPARRALRTSFTIGWRSMKPAGGTIDPTVARPPRFYARALDQGAAPPGQKGDGLFFDRINAWITAKGIKPRMGEYVRTRKVKRKTPRGVVEEEREVRMKADAGMRQAIIGHILKFGTDPHPFIDRAVEMLGRHVKDFAAHWLQETYKELLDQRELEKGTQGMNVGKMMRSRGYRKR